MDQFDIVLEFNEAKGMAEDVHRHLLGLYEVAASPGL
jgi:DNA-directed RNA polymerase alpha subunit